MTTRTVVRLYDSYDDASSVVSELEASGISQADISMISNDVRHQTAGSAGSGAGVGATAGTVLGGGAGLLAGIGALAIPGVGPVVAAGCLIATLAGAGAGAAAGGIIGSLTGAGVGEDEAHTYSEGVRRGGTLVSVRNVDETTAARAESIMDQRKPVGWQVRAEQYRAGGWNRFDPAGEPYATSASSSSAETDTLRTSNRL